MTTIDWNAPIEAVHEDGRVTPVERFGGLNGRNVMPTLEGGWFAFEEDGTHNYSFCPWRIRNVPHQTPTPDVVGRKMTVEEVREMLGYDEDKIIQTMQEWGFALLPEPVDGDLLIAREIVIDCLGMKDHPYAIKIRNGERDGVCQEALAGIKRGRALERGKA